MARLELGPAHLGSGSIKRATDKTRAITRPNGKIKDLYRSRETFTRTRSADRVVT